MSRFKTESTMTPAEKGVSLLLEAQRHVAEAKQQFATNQFASVAYHLDKAAEYYRKLDAFLEQEGKK